MSGLLMWLAIDLACGATWRMAAPHECAAQAQSAGCCEHAPAKSACASEACGLTCATMFVAQLPDAEMDLRPVRKALRLAAVDETASRARARPLLPPPRA